MSRLTIDCAWADLIAALSTERRDEAFRLAHAKLSFFLLQYETGTTDRPSFPERLRRLKNALKIDHTETQLLEEANRLRNIISHPEDNYERYRRLRDEDLHEALRWMQSFCEKRVSTAADSENSSLQPRRHSSTINTTAAARPQSHMLSVNREHKPNKQSNRPSCETDALSTYQPSSATQKTSQSPLKAFVR